jgi:hypothetical protein
MEYVGGEVLIVKGLNVDLLCFWDITSILELYLG